MRNILLLFFILLSTAALSQSTGYLRYDTVRVQKIGGNSTLIIENATRNLDGAFLQNYSQGRTRFAHALDSVWVDGDSIRFRYGSATIAVLAGSAIDTTSLSNRIDGKLDITDTTNKWVGGIYRKPGQDSIYFNIGNTEYSFKDSLGGSGFFSPDQTATGNTYHSSDHFFYFGGTGNKKFVQTSPGIDSSGLILSQQYAHLFANIDFGGKSELTVRNTEQLFDHFQGKYKFTNIPDSTAATNYMMVWNSDDSSIRKAPLPSGDTANLIIKTAGAGEPIWYTDDDTLSLKSIESFYSKNDSTLRWRARIDSTSSSVTPTINTDNVDIYRITAQAADITSFTTNLSGSPNDGDILEIQITGTATRNITWGASFAGSSVALPTATDGTNTLTVIFQFYKTTSYGNGKWICVNYF